MFRATLTRRIALALSSVIVSLSLLQAVQVAGFATAQPARVEAPVRQLLLSLCVTGVSSALRGSLERDLAGAPLPASPVPGGPMRVSHDGHCALCSTDPDLPVLAQAPLVDHLPRIDGLGWRPSEAPPGPRRPATGRVRARAPPIA
ncbi:MAG: hypothetical protein R3E68_17235 [Burkholderiaceae bacterium]